MGCLVTSYEVGESLDIQLDISNGKDSAGYEGIMSRRKPVLMVEEGEEGPGSFGAYFYFHHLSCGRRIGSAQRRTAECTSGSSAPSKVGTTTVPGKSVRETVDR